METWFLHSGDSLMPLLRGAALGMDSGPLNTRDDDGPSQALCLFFSLPLRFWVVCHYWYHPQLLTSSTRWLYYFSRCPGLDITPKLDPIKVQPFCRGKMLSLWILLGSQEGSPELCLFPWFSLFNFWLVYCFTCYNHGTTSFLLISHVKDSGLHCFQQCP